MLLSFSQQGGVGSCGLAMGCARVRVRQEKEEEAGGGQVGSKVGWGRVVSVSLSVSSFSLQAPASTKSESRP